MRTELDVVEEHAYTGEGVHTINLFEKDWEKREVDAR
jgi:galactonate dehydratase